MKKYLLILAVFFCGASVLDAQWGITLRYLLRDYGATQTVTGPVTFTGNVTMSGTNSVTGYLPLTAFDDSLGNNHYRQNNAQKADGFRYFSYVVDDSTDPAASAEIGTGFFRHNKRNGSNGTFTVNGLEGVAASYFADEAGTFRGVYGRTYTNAGATATMRTAVGGEFSVRASFAGGDSCVAESGTAFVGSRIWMAPYFTNASLSNINNFWGLWIYGEHDTYRNGDAAIKIGSAGGGFTADINMQNGNTITNGASNVTTITGRVDPDSLKVAGAASIGNKLHVGAATVPDSTLKVTGGGHFTDGLLVDKMLNVTGNVGIGVVGTVPLDVNGTAYFRTQLYANTINHYSGSATPLTIGSSSEIVIRDDLKSVGINAVPTGTVSIKGTTANGDTLLNLRRSGGPTVAAIDTNGVFTGTRVPIIATDGNVTFTNINSGATRYGFGLSAKRTDTLPAAAVGLYIDFIANDTDSLRITPVAGDVIHDAADNYQFLVGAAGNNILRLVAPTDSTWIVTNKIGTWTGYWER